MRWKRSRRLQPQQQCERGLAEEAAENAMDTTTTLIEPINDTLSCISSSKCKQKFLYIIPPHPAIGSSKITI